MMATKAKVSELKNRLSAYLRKVRRGGKVIVMDRDNVIAEIIPCSTQVDPHGDFSYQEPVLSPSILKTLKPIETDKPIDVLTALESERSER